MYGRVFKAILVILKFTQVKSYSSRSKELSLRPQAGWGPHPFCLLRPLGHIFGSHTYHVVVFCLLVSLDLPAQTVNTWMWGQGALKTLSFVSSHGLSFLCPLRERGSLPHS